MPHSNDSFPPISGPGGRSGMRRRGFRLWRGDDDARPRGHGRPGSRDNDMNQGPGGPGGACSSLGDAGDNGTPEDQGRRGRHGGRGGHGGRGEHGEGRHGERGRVLGRGELPLVVLALLDEAPRHGYEIIRWIEDRCRGGYSPSPGVIYPTLTMLEEQDLTRADPASETGKRRYVITDAGRRQAAENQGLIKGAFARMDMVARMRARELLPPRVAQAMETLKQALLSRGTNWDVQEADRVAAVLEHAALLIIDPTHQNGPDSV